MGTVVIAAAVRLNCCNSFGYHGSVGCNLFVFGGYAVQGACSDLGQGSNFVGICVAQGVKDSIVAASERGKRMGVPVAMFGFPKGRASVFGFLHVLAKEFGVELGVLIHGVRSDVA